MPRRRPDGLNLGDLASLVCEMPGCGQPFTYIVTMGRNPRFCDVCRSHAHREVVRICNRRVRLRGYGLTLEHYDAMLQVQLGRCALCRMEPLPNERSLSVDHDHSCCPDRESACGACVRALLCNKCNANRLVDEMVLHKAAFILYWRNVGPSVGAEHLEWLRRGVVVQAALINIEPVHIGSDHANN